jgi:hypothetical protein
VSIDELMTFCFKLFLFGLDSTSKQVRKVGRPLKTSEQHIKDKRVLREIVKSMKKQMKVDARASSESILLNLIKTGGAFSQTNHDTGKQEMTIQNGLLTSIQYLECGVSLETIQLCDAATLDEFFGPIFPRNHLTIFSMCLGQTIAVCEKLVML